MSKLKIKWPNKVVDAALLQEQHRKLAQIVPLKREPVTVAGVDAAFSDDKVFAAVCVHRYSDMALIEQAAAVEKISFPYVPGYLIFLEGPAIMSALEKLHALPDLIIVDGHGSAHPRNIGAATHLGLLLDIPTIGCAKKKLIGEYTEPDTAKGSWSQLRLEERTIGAVLRTRDTVAPLFVSPGHRIDLEDAVRITLGCTGKFRIPEPLRCADIVAGRMKKRLG